MYVLCLGPTDKLMPKRRRGLQEGHQVILLPSFPSKFHRPSLSWCGSVGCSFLLSTFHSSLGSGHTDTCSLNIWVLRAGGGSSFSTPLNFLEYFGLPPCPDSFFRGAVSPFVQTALAEGSLCVSSSKLLSLSILSSHPVITAQRVSSTNSSLLMV